MIRGETSEPDPFDFVSLLIEEGEIRAVAYNETEHFIVAKSFLNNHQNMIAELLSE